MNDRIKKKKDPVAFEKRGIEIERRKREKKWVKALRDSTCSTFDLAESFSRISKAIDEMSVHLQYAIDALRYYYTINEKGDA